MEPLSWGMVHPDVISVREMLLDAGFDVPEINMKAYMEARHLNQQFIDDWLGLFIDVKNHYTSSLLLNCGLPGGMMGSLMADLKGVLEGINKTQKASGKKEFTQDEMLVLLFDEVAYVWPKLGYPPLVTPFSQYVKNVALVNVMFTLQGKGRYQMIDKNTWDMILGKAGKLPGPLDKEIIELSKKQSYEFYTGNPQEAYPDELPKFRKQMKENNWETGKNDEELFELAMHERQYVDYKSGLAKKRFEEEIENTRKQQKIIQKTVEKTIAPPVKEMPKKPVIPTDPNLKAVLATSKGKVMLGFHEIIEDRFLKTGNIIKKGERICYIYSDLFQGFDEIVSEYDGIIGDVYVKQGAPIAKGDIIAIIKINQEAEIEKK
jgi:pyruvate carboxylase subunit B